ncbi:MAG: DUF1801 domain-containing protein [Acidimicrobiia bacterium]
MEISAKSPDAFLASLPPDEKADMELLDAELTKRFKGRSRLLYEGRFWGGSDQSIIGYGEISYENRSGERVNWFMVGLARQKAYISMYVNAVGDGGYLLRAYADRLGKVKTGSASISFKSVDDVEMDTLMELVEAAAAQL